MPTGSLCFYKGIFYNPDNSTAATINIFNTIMNDRRKKNYLELKFMQRICISVVFLLITNAILMASILAVFKRSTFIQAVQPHFSSHGIELTFLSNNPEDAIIRYKSLQPDVVLMDANWPSPLYQLSGHALVKTLLDCNPAARIIATTSVHEPELLASLKSIGVKGYFTKIGKDVLKNIIVCIKTVHAGGEYYYLG